MSNPLGISVSLTGSRELLNQLNELKRAMRNKILRPALQKAARPMLDSAWANCPERTDHDPHGILKKAMKSAAARKTKTYSRGTVVVIIGPPTGFRTPMGVRTKGAHKGEPWYEDPSKIGHLVEFGHGGPHPAAPHPFMRPAVDTNRSNSAEILRSEIEKGIVAACRR